jgi:hypothetical protein
MIPSGQPMVKLTLYRVCLMIRTLVPQEVNPTSYRTHFKQNGMQIECTITRISAAFDASHTVGEQLEDSDDGNLITGCFEQCSTEDFSAAVTVNDGNTTVEMVRYTVNLPFEFEPRASNPFHVWNYCPPGSGGTVNICVRLQELHTIILSSLRLKILMLSIH